MAENNSGSGPQVADVGPGTTNGSQTQSGPGPLDLSAIRARAARGIRYVRGDDGGEYVSEFWAEEAIEDRDALLAEVEKLRAALREAVKALGETLRYDPGIERALGVIRAALGEP